MKELKLRAWKKLSSNPQMLYLQGILRFGPGWDNGAWGHKLYQFFFSNGGFMVVRAEEVELMLFTGLLDKHKKEIWQGDIIIHRRFKESDEDEGDAVEVICVVKWDQGNRADAHLNPILLENPSMFNDRPGFWAEPVDRNANHWGFAWSEFHDCEVIGNMWEHPHLLKPATQDSHH